MSENIPNLRNSQYLKEMGIAEWQLSHPKMLQGACVEKIVLPKSCKLLLVSSEIPSGNLAVMFEKVLKSMKLEIKQSMHILPHLLEQTHIKELDWVWFAGCEMVEEVNAQVLSSPSLREIEGNTLHKRQLWQQICSYET